MTLPPYLQKYIKLLRRESKGDALNPHRDWHSAVVLFLVFFVASVIWNVWLFSEALSGKEGLITSTPEEAADTSFLEQADLLFEERESEAGRYRSEYRFVDPSR